MTDDPEELAEFMTDILIGIPGDVALTAALMALVVVAKNVGIESEELEELTTRAYDACEVELAPEELN